MPVNTTYYNTNVLLAWVYTKLAFRDFRMYKGFNVIISKGPANFPELYYKSWYDCKVVLINDVIHMQYDTNLRILEVSYAG